MSLILTDAGDKPEAVMPGDPISPEKWENIEVWSFLFMGDTVPTTYIIRVERNERGLVMQNPIDHTPVEIELVFRGDDGKNEIVGGLKFPVVNLKCYGKTMSKQRVYEPGEDPVSRELKLHKDRAVARAETFEKRAAEREAEFDKELAGYEDK